jgi:hypothetical protein
MIRLLAFCLITNTAYASYDVSFITVNGTPTVEIVVNDRVCHYPTSTEELNKGTSYVAKKAWASCFPSK